MTPKIRWLFFSVGLAVLLAQLVMMFANGPDAQPFVIPRP